MVAYSKLTQSKGHFIWKYSKISHLRFQSTKLFKGCSLNSQSVKSVSHLGRWAKLNRYKKLSTLPEQSFIVRQLGHFNVKQNLQHIPSSLSCSSQRDRVYSFGFSQYFWIEIILRFASDSNSSSWDYKINKTLYSSTRF